MIANAQNIEKITMYPRAQTKCRIGGDWYTNDLEIEFTPDGAYPDYMDVNKWVMENIDGKDLNIEEVVSIIYAYLQDTYKPKKLHIVNYISGCKTHFDVMVEK